MNEHPDRADLQLDRWRLIKNGGDAFVEEFLSQRENEESASFNLRRDLTPDPCTASAAIDDLVNTISARLDVTRSGGSKNYQAVVNGRSGGVDRQGTDMQTFIIRDALPELCYMSMYGWLVQQSEEGIPYIIPYKAENIWNWAYKDNKLVAVALRDFAAVIDENGFSTESKEVFRVFTLIDGVVETHLEDAEGVKIDPETLDPSDSTEVVGLDEIPFVFLRLPVPLLQRIDKFQIAVLNMQSSDIDWLRTGNMTIYVEQSPIANSLPKIKNDEDPTTVAPKNQVILGSNTGRSYPMQANQPAFIAPPEGPIRVSMEKQQQLTDQVKDILKTQLNTMKLASAESIGKLSEGLEAGLFVIGVIFLTAEIKWSRVFSKYENKGDDTSVVTYPRKYELRTEEDRLEKAKSLKDIQKRIGSNTAKKFLEVQVLQTLLEGKIPSDQYDIAVKEVMDSDFCIFDPDTVHTLSEGGVISKELASITLGAPAGDSKKAEEEHLERIKAIQISQTQGLAAGTEVKADEGFENKIRKQADDLPDTGGG